AFVSASFAAAGAAPALAQDPPPLAGATIEELMNMTVTSGGRRQQRAEDVPAAIYVITREQIRQSGHRSLPEILRLAPGVQVARAGSSKWAVSIRGFNDVYSNKLLILLDGRSLYNRSFSGVFWESQDVLVDEIERIEVIRGPGGALWGANAMNGVLNIITRHAAHTVGVAAEVRAGSFDQSRVSLRYGGARGALDYRVFSQWSSYGPALAAPDVEANDRWTSLATGFRADWTTGAGEVMAQGRYIASRARPQWFEVTDLAAGTFGISPGVSDAREVTALARWTRRLSSGSVLQVQGSHARSDRDEATLDSTERTSDIDAQVETTAGQHVLVLGGGYRLAQFDPHGPTVTLAFVGERAHIVNAFVNDAITLGPRVTATLGAKLEHDSVSGMSVLPSARVMWNVSPRQRLWTALSRARRTPSLVDRTIRYYFGSVPTPQGPIVLGFIGNPDFGVETLTQAAVGYRAQVGKSVSIDVTSFFGQYQGLATIEPVAPMFMTSPAPPHVLAALRYENLMDLTTRGVEVSAEWAPVDGWRMHGSYSLLRLSPRVSPSSLDDAAATFDGSAPRAQWQIHSTATLAPGLRLDASLYRVGRLRELGVAAYTRADVRVETRLAPRLFLSATGQNLLDRSHMEFTGVTYAPAQIPRSWVVQLRWER
ncbi:MAG: TonB-dependent receptor, partial [Acidobacteriota bacterium]|nr:TonB-dependent receptor [Acidobacteriota bacterium]